MFINPLYRVLSLDAHHLILTFVCNYSFFNLAAEVMQNGLRWKVHGKCTRCSFIFSAGKVKGAMARLYYLSDLVYVPWPKFLWTTKPPQPQANVIPEGPRKVHGLPEQARDPALYPSEGRTSGGRVQYFSAKIHSSTWNWKTSQLKPSLWLAVESARGVMTNVRHPF